MQPRKISLGITGGIGSGKSFVCHKLEERGIPVFYTDAEARAEMIENHSLQISLQNLLGQPITDAEGRLLKPVLSEYIRSDKSHTAQVDALVHPCVRRRMERWIQHRPESVVAVECALLFEAGFETSLTCTVLVAAPIDVRVSRVVARDGKTDTEVRQWISMQMDEAEKRRRADFIIVNDGQADVDKQLSQILASIK